MFQKKPCPKKFTYLLSNVKKLVWERETRIIILDLYRPNRRMAYFSRKCIGQHTWVRRKTAAMTYDILARKWSLILYIDPKLKLSEIKLFMLSNYFRCWCSSSMGKQMIYKFNIIASPVKCPSSLIDSFSLIEIVGCWMSNNRLKLDASKTEFIWLGSTHRLTKCIFDPIIYGGGTIQISQTVRNLDAYIDSAIGFIEHVIRLTRTCLFYITQLWSIRQPHTIESSYALVKSLFLTHLDFCDGHLKGVPKCLVKPSYWLRRVWSCFFVAQCSQPDIPSIVTFKLCGFAFRYLRGSSPPYLVHYTSRRSAPSLDAHIFDLQRHVRVLAEITIFDNWSSGHFILSAWNCLPVIFFSHLET